MSYRVTAIYLAADSGGLGPQNKSAFRAKEDRAVIRDEPDHQRVLVSWSPPESLGVKKAVTHVWVVPYGQIRYMEIEPVEEQKK